MSIKKNLKFFQFKKLKDDFLFLFWTTLLISIGFLFLIIFLESIFWFPSSLKILLKSLIIIIFFIFLIFSLIIFYLFKNNKLKRYSYEKIAIEIGIDHFDSKDELLNAIQLEKEFNSQSISTTLINKLIENVNLQISKININFKKLPKKILKRRNQTIFISFIFLIICFVYLPEFIFSSYRLINFSKEFKPPTPFIINSMKKNIYIMGGDSANVVFLTKGNSPDSIQVEFVGENFNEKKWIKSDQKNTFNYTLKNINQNLSYRGYVNSNKSWERWDEISSDINSIEVIDRPKIQKINFNILPPKYSKLNQFKQQGNIAEIKSLKGSIIKINIESNKNLGESHLSFEDKKDMIKLNIDKKKAFGEILVENEGFFDINISDFRKIRNLNSIKYKIIPIIDKFPELKIFYPELNNEIDESFKIPIHLQIIDDFGFSNLQVVFEIINSNNPFSKNIVSVKKIPINGKNEMKSQDIYFDWNISEYELVPGDEINYHFELYDNDLVSGPKKTKSNLFISKFPSLAELFERNDDNQNEIEKEISKIVNNIYESTKAIRQSELKLIKSKKIDWNEKQKIKQSLSTLNKNIDDLKNISQTIDKIINQSDNNNLFSKEMINKFSKLQNIIKEIMNKEITDDLNGLLNNLEKVTPDELLSSLKKIQSNSHQIERDLDRFIKIFNRINVERKLEEIEKRMKNIIKSQQNLSNNITNNFNSKILKNKQNEIENEFDRTLKIMNSTSKLIQPFSQEISDELNDLNNSNEINSSKNQMKQNQNNLSKNDINESVKSSKEISNKMKSINLKFKNISKKFSDFTTNQMIVNFEKIFLETIYLSKKQELLNSSTINIPSFSSRLRIIARNQQLLKDQLNQLINTFIELSSETFAITPKIGRLIGKASYNMNESIKKLEERQNLESSNHQKQIVKSLNETAFELLKSMENMKTSGSASGYEEFLKQMKNLSNSQDGINSETLSFMLGQTNENDKENFIKRLINNQSEIKKSIQQMMDELSLSQSTENQIKKINDDIEDILNDLSNNRITSTILDKQNKILSRMLNSQKALNKQDYNEKRISNMANNIEYNGPSGLPEDLGQRRSIIMSSLQKALENDYSLDYQNMIKIYFNTLIDSL